MSVAGASVYTDGNNDIKSEIRNEEDDKTTTDVSYEIEMID